MDHREVLARCRLDAAIAYLHVHQVRNVSEELEFWQKLAEVVDEARRTEGAERERQVLNQPAQLLVQLLGRQRVQVDNVSAVDRAEREQ